MSMVVLTKPPIANCLFSFFSVLHCLAAKCPFQVCVSIAQCFVFVTASSSGFEVRAYPHTMQNAMKSYVEEHYPETLSWNFNGN